ncbi:MAG: HAMP domain-containing sensor histidine kinase, partial [Pseudomonadota bacterium]
MTDAAATPADAASASPAAPPLLARRGLSARLFWITIGAVMLVEVLIFLPSAGMFHADWLQRRLDAAALTLTAADAAPGLAAADALSEELLDRIGAAVIAARPMNGNGSYGPRRIIARSMPPEIAYAYDLQRLDTIDHVLMATRRLVTGGDGWLRVRGPSAIAPGQEFEAVVEARPLSRDLAAYGGRIGVLSLIIAVATGALIFLALRWLLVLPMRRLTNAMTDFAGAPEAPLARLGDADRSDEVGQATRTFDQLRRELQTSFARRARLAAMGEAVSKFNHDLRNILAEAMLAADTLEARADAGTARYAAKVNTALDRATALCQESLRFARDGAPSVDRRRFALADLVDAVALETARLAPDGARGWVKAFNPLIDLYADREQVRRVLENLGRNAFEAGARTVTISAERIDADGVAYGLLLADDGPGVPDDIR